MTNMNMNSFAWPSQYDSNSSISLNSRSNRTKKKNWSKNRQMMLMMIVTFPKRVLDQKLIINDYCHADSRSVHTSWRHWRCYLLVFFLVHHSFLFRFNFYYKTAIWKRIKWKQPFWMANLFIHLAFICIKIVSNREVKKKKKIPIITITNSYLLNWFYDSL